MDVNLTANVSAFEKLVDYVASGIGSVAGPMLAPWKARRLVQAKKIAASGDAEIQQIQAEGHARALSIITDAQRSARQQLDAVDVSIASDIQISNMIEQKVRFQEEKRQRNILSIVEQAADHLGDTEVNDHEPDHDWTARFFGGGQDISSEEMQILWGRILAGEVERPGSTSIHTLDILRNLNKETSSLFKIFCSLCVWLKVNVHDVIDARAPSLGRDASGNSLEKYGLRFDALNILNEYGLIISDYNSWFDYKVCSGIAMPDDSPRHILRIPFQHQNRYWVLLTGAERLTELKIHGVALTRSGRELAQVVSIDPTPQYTQDLKNYFQGLHLEMLETESGVHQVTPL